MKHLNSIEHLGLIFLLEFMSGACLGISTVGVPERYGRPSENSRLKPVFQILVALLVFQILPF